MRPLIQGARLLLLALMAAALVCRCGPDDDWSRPHPEPAAIGALGPGFMDPNAPPAPEATIVPRPGSWDGVHPPKGYRVVLLTAGEDAQTKTLVDAVTTWAKQERGSLKIVRAANPDQFIASIVRAIDLKPDLIIAAGKDLVDPLALVTASHLDQQFLVVGAELPEPTVNVTAAVWAGASFRGEGLDPRSAQNPATFTRERAGRAVRAGVAAVLHRITGFVIWLK